MTRRRRSATHLFFALLVAAGSLLLVPGQAAFAQEVHVTGAPGDGAPTSVGPIAFNFDHNVADPAVLGGNVALFSVVSSDGSAVGFDVYADYAGSPGHDDGSLADRRTLFVQLGELQPGVTYTVALAPGARSYGGHVFPGCSVTFMTADPGPGAGEGEGDGAGSGSGDGPGEGAGSDAPDAAPAGDGAAGDDAPAVPDAAPAAGAGPAANPAAPADTSADTASSASAADVALSASAGSPPATAATGGATGGGAYSVGVATAPAGRVPAAQVQVASAAPPVMALVLAILFAAGAVRRRAAWNSGREAREP